MLFNSHLQQGQQHIDGLDHQGSGVGVLNALQCNILLVLGSLVLHSGNLRLQGRQLVLHDILMIIPLPTPPPLHLYVPDPLLALVLHLLLHVRHSRLGNIRISPSALS